MLRPGVFTGRSTGWLSAANTFDTVLGSGARILADADFRLLLLANSTQALGSALLTSLTDPYGVPATEIGLMMSVFTAPAILVIPLLGALIDRYGRKPVLVPALCLFGVSGTALAFTTDFAVVLALRSLQGLGFAGILPVVITSIGDLYDGGEEATGQGLRFAVSGLSQAVFPIVGGGLVVLAWQYPFLLYALAIPVALLVYARFEDPHTAGSTDPGTDGKTDTRGTLGELYELATHTHVAAILLAHGLPVIAWLGFFTYNLVLIVRVLDGTPRGPACSSPPEASRTRAQPVRRAVSRRPSADGLSCSTVRTSFSPAASGSFSPASGSESRCRCTGVSSRDSRRGRSAENS